ncbi:hypothetical protein Pcinc_019314, partial [Petrolisthes cinctipes]
EERGLALWTTDTIDLSRTAPSDLGYSLLPNKYGSGGAGNLGSARAGERSGSRSPSMPRRINALAPLEQGDAVVTVSRVGSTRSVIPPLSAARRQQQQQQHDTHSDFEYDVEEEEEDDDDDDKSEYYYEEEEVEDDEEVEEEVLVVAEEDERSLVSRPKSSATTRDSGISIFSSHDGETVIENGRDEAGRAAGAGGGVVVIGGRDRSRTIHTKSSTSSLSSSLASTTDDPGRSSYDVGMGRGRRGGELVSPSTRSLPNEAIHNTGYGVVGKGLAGGGGKTRSRKTPGNERDFHNFDYESDFETDEEDPNNITLSNTTLTKMKLLRKKKENLKDIERRRQERETRRAQEERARKYKQLEIQHSQNSLQPSRADSGDGRLAVQPNVSYRGRNSKTSPHPSPHRRLKPSPVPSPPPARIPKSRSHNSNLSRNAGRTTTMEKRHRSLERGTTNTNTQQDGANQRLTYRTPQLVKRGQPPGGGGDGASKSYTTQRNAIRIPERSSEPDLMMSVGLRASKPASSCFKSNLKPFASPNDALKNAMELVNSGDWERQVEGTENLARLTKHHHSVIQGDLRNINLALLKLAKNLRSQVSRAAIQAFTILFDTLKRSMEADCEKIAAMLLHRTADTNKFLQLDSHHGLEAMVENISPTKSIPAIIQEGLAHRNPVVRTTVARLLVYEVERLGASKALSGQKDITDKLLPAAAKLAQEGSLETRQFAKRIFQLLIRQGQFDAALKKYVSATDVKNLQKFLDNLTSEGRTIRESARSKYASGARYTRTM